MAHCRLAALVAAAAASTAAWGPGINIDFGDGAGVPPPGYGGAGAPGIWNGIAAEPGTHPLVGLNGDPLAATITLMNFSGALDDPGTSGSDEQLLDDGLFGLGDVVSFLTIDGVANGTYQVIAYAWTPTIDTDFTTVMVGEEFNPSLIVGGPWPGGLEEGVTHVTFEIVVTDELIRLGFVGNIVATSGFLNGLQIAPSTKGQSGDPDDAADLDEDGCVGPNDVVILLTNYASGHGCDGIDSHSCDADINEDGIVDILDLVKLLMSWSC